MSSNDERDLARALHDRSEEMGGHPIGLDAVRADARRIQRRRRVAGAVVAVAAVAVAVPVGLNLTGGTTTGTGPVTQPSVTVPPSPSASPTPSPSASPSPSPSPSASAGDGSIPLAVAGLPTGAPPAVAWIEGRTLHHDGTTSRLPGAYTDVASYHGGWLAAGNGGAGPTITRIDNTGKVVGTAPGGSFIVASGDGTRIAWVESGAIHTALASSMSDVENTQAVPPGATAEVVGWASGDVVYTLQDSSGQTVHLTDHTGHDRVVPGLINAWGSNDQPGLVAGEISYDTSNGTSCWGATTTSGVRLWRQCDWALHAFSPTGRYVVGTPSGCDGIGCSAVALLEARTGKVVAAFKSPTQPLAVSTTQAWEDEGHLLTVVWDGTDWWILR
ncbi:MAG: hypothetical protein ACXVW6_07240, partial [Nocardioidaceae bacterium]